MPPSPSWRDGGPGRCDFIRAPRATALLFLRRRNRRGRAWPRLDDHGLFTGLVFRDTLQLVRREVEDDADRLSSHDEMDGVPVDRDLATADPQETPEVDDGSANLPGAIDDHIDDLPHLVAGPAQHTMAEDTFELGTLEHGRGALGVGRRRLRRRMAWLRLGGCHGWLGSSGWRLSRWWGWLGRRGRCGWPLGGRRCLRQCRCRRNEAPKN